MTVHAIMPCDNHVTIHLTFGQYRVYLDVYYIHHKGFDS